MSEFFHADVVGSMLRPPSLVAARSAMRAGDLDAAEYSRIEDGAVDDALRIQTEAGLDVVTDGEMRRDIFMDFIVTGMSGLSPVSAGMVNFRNAEQDIAFQVEIPFSVTDKTLPQHCTAVEEFQYASSRTHLPVKVALPGPMLAPFAFWHKEHSRRAYPDWVDFAFDAAEAVRSWMRELADAGCTYIQIDAPEMAQVWADERIRAEYAQRGIDMKRFMDIGMEITASLAQQDLPGVTVGLHLCKGNGTQSWHAEGGYDALAKVMFKRCSSYDVFHLEYDDWRSGSFEALEHAPDDKGLALGLVSTKWTEIEDADALRARIDQAARYHPKDRLGIAPQCGFASAAETAEDRKVTPETQAEKLRLIGEVARSVWG